MRGLVKPANGTISLPLSIQTKHHGRCRVPKTGGYREIEHTADWALEVWGEDIAGLLTAAAQGALHLAGIRAGQGPIREVRFSLPASDPETALVEFLSEVLYRAQYEHCVPVAFDAVVWDGKHVQAHMRCGPLAGLEKEIKAVTYHGLRVTQGEDGRWRAVVVFDV